MSKDELSVVFIVDAFPPNPSQVSWFIQRGDPSRRVGPFVGLKDQQRLIVALPEQDRKLIELIQAAGLSNGRLINARFKYVPEIVQAISSHKHLFTRTSRNGSARKSTTKERLDISDRIIPDVVAPIDAIDRGILEVTEDGAVRLSWRYCGLDSEVPVLPRAIGTEGMRMTNGELIRRDPLSETTMLSELAAVLDVPIAEASKGLFDNVAPDRLGKLSKERWAVTYHSQSVVPVAAYFDSSGIAWFESNEEGRGGGHMLDFELVAEAYLRGRGRIEVDGRLIFLPVTSLQGLTDEAALRIVTESSPHVPTASIVSIKKTFGKEERIRLRERLAKDDFHTELMNYQLDGVLWLSELFENSIGGILADEMGLGKTVQTLAFLVDKKIRRTLVVAPASVVQNWKNEIGKFVPRMSCNEGDIGEFQAGILVLSYQRALRSIREIERVEFDAVVLDEGQFAKNVKTKTAAALRRCVSRIRIVLTGTPIENSINDLWAHLTFTNPTLSIPFNRISRNFPDFGKNISAANMTSKAFSRLILRRTKSDVELDLPPMLEKIVYCEMGEAQRAVYDTTLGAFKAMLRSGATARISSIALEAILRLRQCCSYPLLLPSSLNPLPVRDSVKLEAALEIIDGNIYGGRKTIVFSQFRKVSDAIEASLRSRGVRSVRLDGDTTDRHFPVDLFQNDPEIKVIIIGFRAGGFGINLTAAESVVLFDPWWNPAAENQAYARAHRIGQKMAVIVSKLICCDSIEEKMLQLVSCKSSLADSLSNLDVQMTTKELIELIG